MQYLKSQIISFDYSSSKGETTKRMVEPLKLIFKSKDWYLYSFCRDRQDYRLFKLTRMKNLNLLPDTYEQKDPRMIQFPNRISEMKDEVDITLKIDASMSFRVYDEFHNDVTKNEDGSFIIHNKFILDERFFSYLFSFGDRAEVIEPQYIRTEVLSWLDNIRKKYK